MAKLGLHSETLMCGIQDAEGPKKAFSMLFLEPKSIQIGGPSPKATSFGSLKQEQALVKLAECSPFDLSIILWSFQVLDVRLLGTQNQDLLSFYSQMRREAFLERALARFEARHEVIHSINEPSRPHRPRVIGFHH